MQTRIIYKGKKLISLLLVFCMMFSMVPASVLAEGSETEPVAEETTMPEAKEEAAAAPETEQTEDTMSNPETTPEATEASGTEGEDEETDQSMEEEIPVSTGTRATGDSINAALYDDSNTWVNFDTASDNAIIGYASDAEKDYNMQVVLTFPAGATDKKATITLAEGLKFTNDGSSDTTVVSMLSGVVVNNTNTAPYGLGNSTTNTGSKTYSFKDGVEVVTLSLTICADSRYWFDNVIADGITVKMDFNGLQQEEVKLEELTVNSSGKTLHTASGNYTGYAAMDTNITLYSQYRQFFFAMSSWNTYSHFFESFEAAMTVDSNVVVTNTDTSSWTLTSTDNLDDTTKHVFTYKGTNGKALEGNFIIPVRFNFPSSGFSAGDEVTIYRNANAKLYGGKTVFWPQCTLRFTIAGGDSEVFVNYTSVASATSASTLNGNLTALTGSTSSTLNGTVGSYTVGNRGGAASGAQTVELQFDKDKLGVLALDLAVPCYKADGTTRETVTTVEYQTVNGGDTWYTKTGLNLTANDSVNQYRYISWSTLGITQDPMETGDYITAIRYTLGSIPAATVLGINSNINGIYGVTLSAGIGQRAESTVSVYDPVDAVDESQWTTGKIYGDHTRSYIAVHFGSVSRTSVSKSAGETFSFSQRIQEYVSNRASGAGRSSAVEHPIIYLRSESGNPITNIKIVNSRGTDITSYLDITPTYDGTVWTYKIDTANVPGDGAALASYSVHSDGTLIGKYITVSYDIATQPTDSGTYDFVDMLFVETPPPAEYSNYAAQTAAPLGPHNIGTGTGRVWWLTTSNTGSYTIEPRTDITVGLSAKHYRTGDDAYATWTAGSDPIAIGVGDNSAMDIKLDVTNLSGMAVDNPTTIYLPIPKEGEDWSDLMYNGEAFEFSMNLKGEVDLSGLPSGITGTVAYGSVTPTGDGGTLNGYTFEAWNATNADSYNCVKIVLDSLPDSTIPVSLTMQVAVDRTMAGLTDGMVDIWSPLYYEDLTNSAGKEFKMWIKGSYLATETAMGEIQGWIWLDTNKDGVKNAFETSLTITTADGWTVDVYTAGTVGTGTPLQTVNIGEEDDGTAVNNYYHITDILSGSGKYDLVVKNPDNTEYIFTRIGSGSLDNKASGTASNGHTTGVIENPTAVVPTDGSLDTDEAVYNIGVVPSAKTTLSWQSQDTTKGTVTVTGADTGSTTVSTGMPYETITATVTVNAVTGYTFAGWATSQAGAVDSSISKTGPYGESGLYGYYDADYYAVFTSNGYSISYVDHEGNGYTPLTLPETGSVLPTGYTYGVGATIGDAEPYAHTGYIFLGWYAASTSGNKVTEVSTTDVGDKTFYARWSANIYNITYENLNGATNSNPTSYTYDVGVASFANPGTRMGYTFAGWYDAAAGGSQVTSISDTATGDKTLYARWTADSRTVTYKANGGSGSDHIANTVYDAAYTIVELSDTGISRTGYTFAGWNTQTDGNGTAYATGSSMTISGAVVLHAQWSTNSGSGGSGSANSYHITYENLNSASNSNPTTYTYGNGFTLADPGMHTGYTFAGWYDASTGGNQVTAISNTDTGNKTLYARWTPNVYAITVKVVDTNDKTISGYGWTVNKGYGETFNASTPTIQDYTYQYWKLNGTKKSGDIEIASVTAAATVTLVYQKQTSDDQTADKQTENNQTGNTTDANTTGTNKMGTNTGTDKANYQFVKVPNAKTVKAGEIVKYTFTGFGNSWGIPLGQYTIIDKPDKGLDFVSASLPAFKNGAGVTYDVIYYTNQQGRTVLHSDIPANKAFRFNAPDLASGEYITGILLEFGTVPAGFAVGDSLTMAFKVWDNPPSQTLVNVGGLSYKANGEDKEFVTGSASSAITIGGYFGAPKTGDETNVIVLILMMLGSLGGMIAIPVIKRRRRSDEA